MLHTVILFLSFSVFAGQVGLTPKMRECMSDVFHRQGFELSQQRVLRMTQGERAFDARIRRFIADAEPDPTTKHTSAKVRTPEDAKRVSKEGSKPYAQFLPGLDRTVIERRALGVDVPGAIKDHKGVLYKYVRFRIPLGYDGGELTHFMRVELGANGRFHGHPMTPARVRDAIGNAEFKELFER